MSNINIYAFNKILACYEVHLEFSAPIDGVLEIKDDGIYIVENGKEPWNIGGRKFQDEIAGKWCDNCEYIDGCPVQISARWNHSGNLPKA